MTMKKPFTVFHVEFRSGTHLYFGSIAAIFDLFDPSALGVKQHRLYDFNIEEDKPYSNKICTIRKGIIRRKPGNRTNPSNATEK